MSNKRRIPISLSIAWRLVVSAIVPAMGVVFSLKYNDWTWFARSGSLMVTQSIAYFALAYISDVETVLFDLRKQFVPPDELSPEMIDQGSVEAKIRRLKHSSVSYATAAIWAVLGTLVWGFGDWAGLLFD